MGCVMGGGWDTTDNWDNTTGVVKLTNFIPPTHRTEGPWKAGFPFLVVPFGRGPSHMVGTLGRGF